MKTPIIKTHKMKNSYQGLHFFILAKGMNAGKPMANPCPNCFVLLAKDEAEKSIMYWLCFGLWQANFFHPFITGSVIPYIRIEDLKQVITTALQKINATDFQKSVTTLQGLEQYQQNIGRQLELIKLAKKSLMYKILK